MAGRQTRKVKQGKIDIDYSDNALLINYEIELVFLIVFVWYELVLRHLFTKLF